MVGLCIHYWGNFPVTKLQTPANNLLITGGINHDFDDAALALSDVLSEVNVKSTIVDDIDAAFRLLSEQSFDLVTLFTLRWRMLDDDKYIPFREQWAFEISESDQQLLTRLVEQGGGLLGLHTAAICFDTWPGWFDLLGARWQWGSTFHPPPAPLTVTHINASHATTQGLEDFVVVDEIYHNVEAAPHAQALFSARSEADDSLQTLAWASEYGQGRVVYNALCHDRASIEANGHARFLQQAARWAIGGV